MRPPSRTAQSLARWPAVDTMPKLPVRWRRK
jgi:hypothetical protein